MTDRELLEKAAKAAELDTLMWCGPRGWLCEENGSLPRYYWNPLTDDGAALRLAVKLRMKLRIEDYGGAARIDDGGRWSACEAHLHGGTEAATRRAIVRAAASIGEKMP